MKSMLLISALFWTCLASADDLSQDLKAMYEARLPARPMHTYGASKEIARSQLQYKCLLLRVNKEGFHQDLDLMPENKIHCHPSSELVNTYECHAKCEYDPSKTKQRDHTFDE